MLTFNHVIAGTERPSHSGHHLDVFDPASGRVYAQVAAGDAVDAAAAIAAAQAAFPAWSTLPHSERARWLERLADARSKSTRLNSSHITPSRMPSSA